MITNNIKSGYKYVISGNLSNGYKADGTPNTTFETIVSKVVRVTDTHVICEYGRRFIKDNTLTVSIW